MTYDQLVAFTSVAAEGTFTGASDALHKSQPAVSKLIRNLEGELGVVLFDRTRYRATLTDAGSVFYERAAAVVESTHALRGFGFALGGKVEAIVRLAVEAVTPLDPIVKILRAAEARFPSVRVELHTERLAGAAEALHDGAPTSSSPRCSASMRRRSTRCPSAASASWRLRARTIPSRRAAPRCHP